MGVVVTLFCVVGFLSAVIIASNISTTTTTFSILNSTDQMWSEGEKQVAKGGINDSMKPSLSSGRPNYPGCTAEYDGFCLNGGTCIYLTDVNTSACICKKGYGGERCDDYRWWAKVSGDCDMKIGDVGLFEMVLLLLLAVSLVIIVLLSIFLIRYRRKLQASKSKLENPALLYDYETYKFSNQARISQEMVVISEDDKKRFMSRSAPTTLGRISSLQFAPSTEHNNQKNNNHNNNNNNTKHDSSNNHQSQQQNSSANHIPASFFTKSHSTNDNKATNNESNDNRTKKSSMGSKTIPNTNSSQNDSNERRIQSFSNA